MSKRKPKRLKESNNKNIKLVISIVFFIALHAIEVDYIYTQPTSDYDLIGEMSASETNRAMETTLKHNAILNQLRGNTKATLNDVIKVMEKSREYRDATEDEINSNAAKIYS